MRTILFCSAGVLVLCALSASAAEVTPDHFNCYFAPAPQQPQFGWLQDQFDRRIGENAAEDLYDLRLTLFCNPTSKTVFSLNGVPSTTPMNHPEAHLAWYRVNPQPVIPRQVPITNQFGAQTLTTGEAEFLAVPSGKTQVSFTTNTPPQLPKVPDEDVLDHFKCYSATGATINKTVLLKDQFFTSGELATVLSPRFFCNPVRKGVPPQTGCPPGQLCALKITEIHNPSWHLACYLTSTKSTFQGVVVFNNQFVLPGTLPTLAVKNPLLLCVPSHKSEDRTVISGPNSPGN